MVFEAQGWVRGLMIYDGLMSYVNLSTSQGPVGYLQKAHFFCSEVLEFGIYPI